MFRKFAALLLGLTLVLLMTLPVFAGDSDGAFEVVEPNFGKNNEVMTKNLLINIRIYEEIPLEMTLVRVEPNIADAVVRDRISSLQDSNAYMMPILPQEDVQEAEVGDVDIPFDLQDSYSENERRNIAQSYLETLESKQSAEEEFIRAYNQYNDLFYSIAEEQIIVGEDLTFYEQEVIKEYKLTLQKMLEVNYVYDRLSPIYESIFETVVLGPEDVELDGVIPYYTTVVEEIKPGAYKLIFSSDDDIIDIKEFTVKKLEEEKIKEKTTNILKNVLNENEDNN